MSQLVPPERKIVIPLLNRLITQQQLDSLRTLLNQRSLLNIDLINKGIKLTPKGDFLFQDFAIEANESDEQAVRQAISDAGLAPAKPLQDNPRIQEDLRRLIAEHARNEENPLRFAIWFRRHDPTDIFLLEIADGIFDPGTGELEGIGMNAAAVVRGARFIVLSLVSPSEVHKALEVNPSHPLIQALSSRDCDILYPETGGWNKLVSEFPELEQAHG